MPLTVRPERYLGVIGWRSCLDRHNHRSRNLDDPRWGYHILLKDIEEIERAEERYFRKHGELPDVAEPRHADKRQKKQSYVKGKKWYAAQKRR